MKRKGAIFIDPFILVIIAIVMMAILVAIFLSFSGKINLGLSYFFNFGKTEVRSAEGDTLIGIELINQIASNKNNNQNVGDYFINSFSGPLKHYDGSAWVNFGKEDNIKIGDKELKPAEVRDALASYYLFTKRYGTGLFDYSPSFNIKVKLVNSGGGYNSLLFISEEGRMRLDGEMKPGIGILEDIPVISVDFNDLFYGSEGEVLTTPPFPDKLRKAIISYRDQIIEGGMCEKNLKIGDKEYSVKKVGNRLYIDLNDKLSAAEKYAPGCFKSDLSVGLS